MQETDKIYPITVTVYITHDKFLTGLVYTDQELEEIVGFTIDKKLFYTVAYRTE